LKLTFNAPDKTNLALNEAARKVFGDKKGCKQKALLKAIELFLQDTKKRKGK